MLERFRMWYLRNYTEISWFLIGFLVMTGLVQAGRGEYLEALLSWAIAVMNYLFVRR